MSSSKSRPPRGSLLLHLTLLYAGVFAVSALLVLLFSYAKIHRVTMDELDAEMAGMLEAYRELAREGDLDGVRAAMAALRADKDRAEEFLRLFGTDGEEVDAAGFEVWRQMDKEETLARLRRGAGVPLYQTLESAGEGPDVRVLSGLLSPALVLQIGETLEDAEDYLAVFGDWFLHLLLAAVALSSGVGWLLAKRALGDLERVTDAALVIADGDYDRRVRVQERFAETRRLAAAFNRMLDRIQEVLQAMREVNANIAHDLRSPLTRLRGRAEMALVQGQMPGESREMAADTVEECDRLLEMVNTLLEISALEAGISSARSEPLDLAQLLRSACELFQPLARDQSIRLITELPQRLDFHGDRKKLQRIIGNLLDNAIKYTPPGGDVAVVAHRRVSARRSRVEVVFRDTGIGIAERDLPFVFDRFYRCDHSRTPGAESAGAGLGLSLAKAFTEAMGGRIEVTSRPQTGSEFSIVFPHRDERTLSKDNPAISFR